MSTNELSQTLVEFLESLDTVSYAVLPSIIGLLLANGITATQQAMLGSFITEIGDTLSSISGFEDAIAEASEEQEKEKADTLAEKQQQKILAHIDELQKKNEQLQQHISSLENKINAFYK